MAAGVTTKLPKDAVWGAGAGDQLLLVVPSLNLIMVRNGETLEPGPDEPPIRKDDVFAQYHDYRARILFEPLAEAVTNRAVRTAAAPYPPSSVIREVQWDETIVRRAARQRQLAAGLGGRRRALRRLWRRPGLRTIRQGKAESWLCAHRRRRRRISEARMFARCRSAALATVPKAGRPAGCFVSKARSIFGCATWATRNWPGAATAERPGRGPTGDSPTASVVRRFWSSAETTPEHATRSSTSIRPTLIPPTVQPITSFWLVFLKTVCSSVRPMNSSQASTRRAGLSGRVISPNVAAVFTHRGHCYRPRVTYNAALQRYLLVHPVPNPGSRDAAGKIDTRFNGGLAIFDAPEPWGPWTTVFFTEQWDVGPGDSASFPVKWMSADGTTLHLVFAGDDCFSVRRATLARSELKTDESHR